MPITNQNVANQAEQQAEAQRRIQMQQMAKSPTPATPSAIQQLGGQAGANRAAAQTAGLQAGAQQAVQQAQVQNQQQQVQQAARNTQAQEASQQRQLDRKAQLQQLDRDMSNEMLDATMNLQEQRANMAFNNERQMMDWMVDKAESEEQLKDWMQQADQQQAKKISMLDEAYKMGVESLEFEYSRASGQRKRELEQELVRLKERHEEAIARAKKKAKKKGGFAKMAIGAVKVGAAVYTGNVGLGASGASDIMGGYGASK